HAHRVDLEDLVERGEIDLGVRAPLVVPLRDLVRDALLLERERTRAVVRAELADDAVPFDRMPHGRITRRPQGPRRPARERHPELHGSDPRNAHAGRNSSPSCLEDFDIEERAWPPFNISIGGY